MIPKIAMTLALMLLISACSDDKPKGRLPPDPKRVAGMEKLLSQPAKTRQYQVNGNELLVVDVPVQSGRVFVDRQRCYVWRDKEFKTANMSCEQKSDIDIDSLVAEPQ